MTAGISGVSTKKELKGKVGEAVAEVSFYETSMFGAEIPDVSGRFTVAGPDAYRNRKWFATVHVKDGVITKVE